MPTTAASSRPTRPYLTDPDLNTGAAAPGPHLSITGPDQTLLDTNRGDLIGPFTVTGNLYAVSVSATGGTLVDAAGWIHNEPNTDLPEPDMPVADPTPEPEPTPDRELTAAAIGGSLLAAGTSLTLAARRRNPA